jgi:hypothetical protein
VFGIAILATVFSNAGGYATPQLFVAGLQPAAFVGAAVLALGAVCALFVPGRQRNVVAPSAVQEPAPAGSGIAA